jgi:2-keto-4-pentenoate hydratase
MEKIHQTAAFLTAMRQEGRIQEQLPADLVPPDLKAAYIVQAEMVEHLLGGSDQRPMGYKVACTNSQAQELVKVDHPIYGRILSNFLFSSPARVRAADYANRIVEPEFAFRMAADAPAGEGPYTPETIADRIDCLLPSFELVDHYWRDWTNVGPLVMAADNAFHGAWIKGEEYGRDWRSLNLAEQKVTLSLNGRVQSEGNGAAVLGHPLEVMAWLANVLPEHGLMLRQADYVTTGVCTGVVVAQAGDTVRADFGPIGRIELGFD